MWSHQNRNNKAESRPMANNVTPEQVARWYLSTLKTVVEINGGNEITDDTEILKGFDFPPVSPEMAATFFQVVSPFVDRKKWGMIRKDAVLMQHISTKQQIEISGIIKKIADQDDEISNIKTSGLTRDEKILAAAKVYIREL